jgi:hypothetical protein
VALYEVEPHEFDDERRGPKEAGEAEAEQSFAVRFLLPYIEDFSLWPILAVAVLDAAVFVAAAVLFAARDQSPVAIFSTGICFYTSWLVQRWDRRRHGRWSAISGLAGVVWVLGLIAACCGAVTGII